MKNEDLKFYISTLVPSSSFDDTGEFLTVMVEANDLLSLMKKLRHQTTLHFDYLFCLTCVDWKDHLMMVYHLNSRAHHFSLVVKAKITDTVSPEIETVSGIWKTAELLEREVFDLFGVKFTGHPDLRRLFLDDKWDGFPLRKNYVDVNMIKL